MDTVPENLAVQDINDEAKLDIVKVNNGSSNADVLLNKGSSTFTLVSFYAVGNSQYAIAVNNLNHDNISDVVLTNIGIRIGQGNGTFRSQYTLSTSVKPNPIEIGDINEDNEPDIIVTSSSSNNFGVLLHG
ncbi:hypothetical protein I4U23_022710 [Adineta vaga]|nr:hypothetical protein I4U23_022710 [Adineta vaga]